MTKTTDDDHCFWILSTLETVDLEDPEHVDEVVTACLSWARAGHILAQQRAAVRGTWTVSLPELSEPVSKGEIGRLLRSDNPDAGIALLEKAWKQRAAHPAKDGGLYTILDAERESC